MQATPISLDAPSTGRERVLLVLKTKGPQTADQIARRLGVTTMAVHQHLAVLSGEELVNFTHNRHKVGRPARLWRLTPNAYNLFPDHHAELAVGMIQAIQSAFGNEGLNRLTEERMRQQITAYRSRMPEPSASLEERVIALARIRREEGYMAESRAHRDGSFEIIENHCSIADAARLCQNLCGCELSLFRTILGKDVAIERSEHILSGDRCCIYRITHLVHAPA